MNKGILYLLVLLTIATSVFAGGGNPCNNPGLSCVDAVNTYHCLTGSISGGNAKVTNNAAASYNVGLAIYKVFDQDDHTQLEHQELFDSATGSVNSGKNLTLSVDLPGCQYQIDLFCGPVIEKFDQAHGVIYGDKKLSYYHEYNQGFCVKPYCGDGIKNGAEECDGTDGVGAHQACTAGCKIENLPYCGDGITNLQEACDAGNDNGAGCTPNGCGLTCNYCDSDCTTETNFGGSCCNPATECCYTGAPGCGTPGVPEFSPFTLGIVIIGVGLGLALLRKHN
jgi:hypothetical protein